ncbi:MAG: primosomal protein N' [Patescibacteria group bacterium]
MKKEEKNTIIDVIPLTRLPLTRQQSFSYLNDSPVSFGSLVSIPLFRRNINGIVINNRDDFFRFGHIKLKKINKILDEKFLTEKQLELAKFVSEYYLCPLGIVLKFFVVKKTKSRDKEQETRNKKFKKIVLAAEQKKIVAAILKNTKYEIQDTKYLLIAGSEGVQICLELIKKNLKAKKQTLLLVPEIPLAYHVLEILREYFDENSIALFHSQLKGSELYENYTKIKSGEAKIIIGTRQAVFAPFKNLGLIIVDEEQDISYKQWDMNPRYSAVKVAEELAKIYNSKLVLWSIAPNVDSYYKHERIMNHKSRIKDFDLEIVDMRNEGWNNNSRKRNNNIIFSKKLISEIGFTLKYGKQVFLFVNRRGMSSFSICASCKEVFRCPRCERALIYDSSGIYRCFHCSYKTDIFPYCPKCNGVEFKNIGTGNQTVEREIKKIFPGAKTKLVDFESLKSKDGQQKIFENIRDKKHDILIGTQAVLKGWELPYLGLIGIINADDLLDFSDFNSDEKAFQALMQIKGKASNGKLVIQAYNPDNYVIKYVIQNDLEGFYAKIIEERKTLKYPPFYKIIKLILRTANKKIIEKESAAVFERIRKLSERDKNISIFEPFTPQLSKVRDKFRKQIIIKIHPHTNVDNLMPLANNKNIGVGVNDVPQELKRHLKMLSSDWVIDVDPISLI